MSSSPPLPALEDIMSQRPPVLRTGSRAASILQNASASFTCAASSLKSTSALDTFGAFALEDDVVAEAKPAKTVKPRKAPTKKADNESKVTKKPRKSAATTTEGDVEAGVVEKKKRKPRAKKTAEVEPEDLEKPAVARKPRAKKVEQDDNPEAAVAKEKTARKPKVKKAEGEPQTKLSKGKVTKTLANAEDKLNSAKTQIVKLKCESPVNDLPKAVKRRASWTPPAAATKIGTLLTGSVLSPGVIDSGQKSTGFADLFGSYGFTKLENTSVPTLVGSAITRKRKLIELVKTSIATSAAISPVPKDKAPKKKAKTLTDQATSAYTEEEELPAQSAPLLQYFSVQTTERSSNDGFKVPAKPRSKSSVKTNSKSKKGSAQAPILLSPESAMKQVGNQDFVFGTSSQLAREDSPTLLRDLHAAMQASNVEDDPFADSIFDSSPPVPTKRTGIAPKRKLWSAASRDDSGELLDVPMIDLVNSPAIINQISTLPAAMATPVQSDTDIWHGIGTTPAVNATHSNRGLDIWHDIGSTPAPRAVSGSRGTPGPIEAAIRTELLSSPSGSRLAKSPGKSKDDAPLPDVESPTSKPKATNSPAKIKKPASLQMPNFSAYTDAQLRKEIASYKFKPIKKREQMIILLEKCWKSKHESALNSLSTNMPVIPPKVAQDIVPPSSQPPKTSPKRPRGRPRKETTVQYLEMDSDTPLSQSRTPKKASEKPTQNTEDISDLDTPPTPSPRRRKASQISPLPLKRISSDLSDSPDLSPDAAQELLFKHIHTAVTSAPWSKDPLNPSWHEKILLYDPIVLEDLTVWLNTGGLGKVGWDGEVDPKLVKKWCESKSICCLWRENLRGGARSRY